ncbi:hypothetical protein OROGR_011206 [Orobanche gracilis]
MELENGVLWDTWVEEALSKLDSLKVLRSPRPIHLSSRSTAGSNSQSYPYRQIQIQLDRASVEVSISESTFQNWLNDVPCPGIDDDSMHENTRAGDVSESIDGKLRKLIVFSGNDYLGLSSHPMVRNAASKAAQEHGMGPRGSALICGYTNYHRLLESSLADLKRKEDCLLCPTGFSANMAFMTAVGNIGLLVGGGESSKDDRVAIFSDALNHASIIDGIHLAEKQGNVVAFVYKHCDMGHLDVLLQSNCPMKKRVVVTDSLFSMDGDFAPMTELAKLRKKHDFLFVIDDAHATFVCGENGGGAAEKFNCETDVDICIGTLSKAAGCHGGFIACSTAVIISIVVGREDKALQASRHLLKLGFHVTVIRPPTIPSNSCRLRVTLSAAHTKDDLIKLANGLADLEGIGSVFSSTSCHPKL